MWPFSCESESMRSKALLRAFDIELICITGQERRRTDMECAELDGIEVSRLGMGNMRLPKKLGRIDYDHAERMVDYALESGINYFDTAWVYPGSESFLGRALVARHPRDSFYLATKYYALGNPNYKKVFKSQLKKLGTDHIDFYLIHCLTDSLYKTYVNKGSIEYFLKMKDEGKIGHLGFSTHASVDTTRRFADHHDWDFAQIQLNYYDWAFGNAREEYEIMTERNIPIVVMEPVRGGKLAKFKGDVRKLREMHPEWSAASWALRWVMRLPNTKVILSGMSSMQQMEDNVATFNGRALTSGEAAILMQSCDAIHDSMALPCTACGYCLTSCPEHIDIPSAIEAYNDLELGEHTQARNILDEMENGPDRCISCGACKSHCPQSINIPEAMTKLS